MATCLVGVGANLVDPRRAIETAVDRLVVHDRIELVAQSALIETDPVGGPAGQNRYLNGALRLESSLDPHDLCDVFLAIEASLGRVRERRWDARTIDLDLLLYDDRIVRTERLEVPHPRMVYRRFVLEPAAKIAGEMVHPTSGLTIAQLRANLDGPLPYIALAGPIGVGKTELAREMARRFDVRTIEERVSDDLLTRYYDDPAQAAKSTEDRFLIERASLLDVALAPIGRLAISDFWFFQSLAFADLFLEYHEYVDFCNRWAELGKDSISPTLVVLLDASTETLLARIARRGREYERKITADWLDQLREKIVQLADARGHAPVLRINAENVAHAEAELAAVVEQMRPRF